MKKMNWIFAHLLLLASSGIALAQADKQAPQFAARQVADEWITHSETRLVAVADAMPADKYSLSHSSNHYGQMVEYLRMNGIVPPASQ